jgi:hypothetical protein
MRRHLVGLIVMFAAVVASAALAAHRWAEICSPQFVVLTNASERDDRHIANQPVLMREIKASFQNRH